MLMFPTIILFVISNGGYDVFTLCSSFLPWRIMSTRRSSVSRTRTQEVQGTWLRPLPTYPRTPLLRCITQPSTFNTFLTLKLEVRPWSPDPAPLHVNILLWGEVQSTPPSVNHPELQRILSARQSTCHRSCEQTSVRNLWNVLNVWPRFLLIHLKSSSDFRNDTGTFRNPVYVSFVYVCN